MMKINKLTPLVLLVSVLMLLSGCSHVATVTTNISPTAIVAERKSEQVAVVFSPQLLSASAHTDLDGTGHDYTFNAGDALKSALTKSTEVVYKSVNYQKNKSVASSSGGQIYYDLNYFDMSMSASSAAFSPNIKTICNISVTIEVYDSRGRILSKKSASGTGFSSYTTSSPSKAADYSAEAAAKAIQQLSDNVANLLMIP